MVGRSILLPGVRFTPPERRVRLLAAHGIDLVLDVGANAGQYANALREEGYSGRIVSFEPLEEPYRRLADFARSDAAWECRHTALGARSGAGSLHVTADTRNSSLLRVGARHLRAVPNSRMVAREAVRIDRLDAIWPGTKRGARRPYLKIDTQGFELEVLRGTGDALQEMAFVEAEVSLVRVYDSAPSADEVLVFLSAACFAPIAFEGVLDDIESGEMLMADVIFRRAK
jgi:FkbM family methyltransferase